MLNDLTGDRNYEELKRLANTQDLSRQSVEIKPAEQSHIEQWMINDKQADRNPG